VIAGVVGWVDLCAPDVRERLEYFSRFEVLRGFRHIAQSEPDDRFLIRDDFVRGIGCLRSFHFTFDLLVRPRQLPAAVELVENFPDQPFVLDHMAKPFVKTKQMDAWASDIRRLAAYPRVSCKLSGLITEADWRSWRADDFQPYLDVVFEAFGTDRLMFGSDWPVCLLAGTYTQVTELIAGYISNLSDREKSNLFGRNAFNFYNLKAMANGSGSH
jgi:L-fuconolactonase